MHSAPEFLDYLIHFGLEAVGAAIGVYAFNFCRHVWHRLVLWFCLTAFTTVVTVNLVG